MKKIAFVMFLSVLLLSATSVFAIDGGKHHMDMPWQFVPPIQPVMVAILILDRPVYDQRVEREDTCIGDSWAKKVVVTPPPPPPPPPPVVVAPPPPPPPPVAKPLPSSPPILAVKKQPILDPVLFDVTKSYINPMGAKVLDKDGKILQENPNMKVEIGGHTDSTGSEAANKVISEKRANSCKKYLMDKFSITGSRLTTKGYGSSKPIADNKTAEGREKNRRVEFRILEY